MIYDFKLFEVFKTPISLSKKNKKKRQILSKNIKRYREYWNPIISINKLPTKNPKPFEAFFRPVNHDTHLNKIPFPSPETIFIADFDDVLEISFAMPDMPCAIITHIMEEYISHEGE